MRKELCCQLHVWVFFLLTSVGFRLCTAIVLSQLLAKSNYNFSPPYLQVCVLTEGDCLFLGGGKKAHKKCVSVFSK